MTTHASSQLDFDSLLRKVPGLGPRRQDALAAAGVRTIGDLLGYYPVRYIDRSQVVPIINAGDFCDKPVTIRGVVDRARAEFWGRGSYRVTVKDDSGGAIDAVWYIRSMKITAGETLVLTGKAINNKGKLLMVHPSLEKITEKEGAGFRPILAVYSIKEPMREAGVNQKLMRKSVEWALKNVGNYPQTLPKSIEKKHAFPPLAKCLYYIHLPDDLSTIGKFRERLKYEELYRLALNLRWNRKKFALPGHPMIPGDLDAAVRGLLPFELTESQEGAVKILHDDAAKPHRMHRLLQGDVGSGKTVTALMASLPALNSGRQVAWMAPTEILARQTFTVIQKYLGRLGIEVHYLGAGSSGSPEKRHTLMGLASGNLRFVVGTHALFMPSVKFGNLGMVVIDEQHKFGAAQRLKLQEKGAACDFLLMSATPIPQTLAKTLYGDLDIVEIASRPNRAPVSTHIVPDNKRADMEKFILEQIAAGARVFYVVPRIESVEDDGDDDPGAAKKASNRRGRPPSTSNSNTASTQNSAVGATIGRPPSPTTVDAAIEKLAAGPLSSVPIHHIHGQMSCEERESAIAAFRDGPPGILVATTIVEVGIDIGDAAVMVIENPEMFGLAQLHQIRGRVGRGADQSYCFLLPGANVGPGDAAHERLKFLCGCFDGFEIAEWDLRHRGPGDAAGYRQSGWDDLCAADILEDSEMFREILRETEGMFDR